MRKLAYVLAGFLAAVPFVLPGRAAVTVTTQPTSLVTSPVDIKASSTPLTVFKFALTADAGETLASAKVTVANAGSSVAAGTDVGSVTVYKDDGDDVFEPGVDPIAGTETTVNIGSVTTVATPSNNGLPGTFFVTFATSASWSDALPKDSVSITFTTDGVVTSANSPVVVSVTTSTITADTTGPALTVAQAVDSASTVGKTAGDTVALTFGETTNKPVITQANIGSTFSLSSGHSFLDGSGALGGASWNASGTVLTITLSGATSLPTVVVGDTVTVQGSLITDASGSSATGSQVLSGTFGVDTTGPALTSAQAFDSASTVGKTSGDTIVLTFGEATNKPSITQGNIASALALSSGRSFLDGSGALGGASWNASGTTLTITLSNATSLPTVNIGDTVTVQGSLIQDALGNSATGSQTIGGTFGADSTGPVLVSAQATDAASTPLKTAGDIVALTFGEATNKPSVTKDNIDAIFDLSGGHSFLDGSGNIGSATWNADGTILMVTLSSTTSLPTVALGDTVTVQGTVVKDVTGNNATGSQTITGSFGSGDQGTGTACGNGIINGRLYYLVGSTSLYQAAGCELKEFIGQADQTGCGHKFKNVVSLNTFGGTIKMKFGHNGSVRFSAPRNTTGNNGNSGNCQADNHKERSGGRGCDRQDQDDD